MVQEGPARTIYLDESGDLGFSFPASSRYLTLACITVPNPRALKKAVRRLKMSLGFPRDAEFKASEDRWEVRRLLLSLVPALGIEVRSLSVCKPNCYQSFRENANALYNFTAAALLAHYLCSCSSASLVVDRREIKVANLPYQFDDYLKFRVFHDEEARISLDIRHEDSFVSAGVQLADCVAHALWRRLERNDRSGHAVILPQVRSDRRLFER